MASNDQGTSDSGGTRAAAGVAAVSPLMTRLEQRSQLFSGELVGLGFASVFEVGSLPKDVFVKRAQHAGISSAKAIASHEHACDCAAQLARLFRRQRHLRSSAVPVAGKARVAASSGDQKPTWELLFTEDWFTFCDENHLDSEQGPVAYLCELYQYAKQIEAGTVSLDTRRPDLKDLLLDWDSTYHTFPMLEQVNDMLESLIIASDASLTTKDQVNEALATTRSPMPLPYDLPAQQIELVLADKQVDYATVCSYLSDIYPLWQSETKDMDHLALNVAAGSELRTWFNEAPQGVVADLLASTVSRQTGLDMAGLMDVMRLEGITSYDVIVSANVDGFSSDPHPGLYGASYINGHVAVKANVFTLEKNSNSGAPQFTVQNPGARMDSLNRFVRLQKILGIPYRHLDSILYVVGSNGNDLYKITQNSLRALGVLKVFAAYQTPLEAEVFAQWLLKNDILPMGYGLTTEAALVDRVFNSDPSAPSLHFNESGSVFNPWLKSQAGNEDVFKKNQWKCARLCEGLKIDMETLKSLTLFINSGTAGEMPLSISNVSRLYSLATLAQACSFSPRGLVLMLPFMSQTHVDKLRVPVISVGAAGTTSRDTLDVLVDVASLNHWMRKESLSITQLLQWLTSGDALSLTSTDSQIKTMVTAIQTQISPYLVTLEVLKAQDLPQKATDETPITDDQWRTALMAKLLYHEQDPQNAGEVNDDGILKSPADAKSYFTTAWTSAFQEVGISGSASSEDMQSFIDFTLASHAAQHSVVYQALMSWLSGARSQLEALCAWCFGYDLYVGLGRFIYRSAQANVDALSDPYMVDLYNLVRHKNVSDYFKLSGYALSKLAAGRFVHTTSVPPQLDITLLYQLSRYVRLLGLINGNEESLWHGIDNSSTNSELAAELSVLLDWSADEIEQVLAIFSAPGGVHCMSAVEGVVRYREMIDKLGLNVQQLLMMRNLTHSSSYAQWKPVGDALVSAATATSVATAA